MAERPYDFRVIPLEQIDEPTLPMREAMDPEKLVELARSIRDKGIMSPLGVYAHAGRFVIIYGHRRYVAAMHVGESHAPCRVHEDGSAREEDFKFTENYYREEVNPAEEATWFAALLERKHDGNIETLCAELNLKESFIQGRLDLLRGDDQVLDALRTKQITLSVARELNKVRDEGWRRHYLADAMEQGATAIVVNRWRIDHERRKALEAAIAAGAGEPVAPSSEASITSVDNCLLCALGSDPLEMRYVRVHESCLKQHIRFQQAAAESRS